jgi:hypothetical protein
VLRDDFAGGVFAAATAGADRELALDLEQRPGAVVDGISNLAITYCVADTNVHVQPLFSPAAAAASHGVNIIANKNDCQLHRLGRGKKAGGARRTTFEGHPLAQLNEHRLPGHRQGLQNRLPNGGVPRRQRL